MPENFQCLTCEACYPSHEMMKHLSQTRHKKIIDYDDLVNDNTETVVQCDECGNDNIHLLSITRFGGDYMTCLCTACFNKEYGQSEKPSTSYTLSNGSILDAWKQLYRVQNCVCSSCGTGRSLNVNATGNVLCSKCLNGKPGYFGEESGVFLYHLLKIKQTSTDKKNEFKRGKGRKGIRSKMGGRGGKKERKEKKLTLFEELAKKAYEIKKQNSVIESVNHVSLKNFKGVKAGDITKAISLTSRSNKGPASAASKSSSKSSNEQKSSKAGPFPPKSNSTKSKHSSCDDSLPINSASRGKASSQKEKVQHKNILTKNGGKKEHITKTGGETPAYGKKEPYASPQSIRKNGGSENNGPKDPSHSSDRVKNVRDGKSKETSQSGEKIRGLKNNLRDSSSMASDKIKSRPGKSLLEKNSSKRFDGKKTKEATKIVEPVARPKPKGQNSDPSKTAQHMEEGEVIERYTKYVPKLSYPDLNTYFDEYSMALFQEQKLENDFIQSFKIVWPMSDSEKVFMLTIKRNNPELEALLPSHLLKLGRLPFTNQQPLMVATQDEEQVWYTYVKEIKPSKDSYMMLMELYPWNKQKLPRKLGVDMLKILPCNSQVNRILFAMTRVKNPAFIDLILGQKPIKQINFDVRLKFTKETLNESQKNAIKYVFNNHVTLLQGPPGTGKTSTIEEIILQLINSLHSFPILCVAASNIAIDNIAEKFMNGDSKFKIVRICSISKQEQYNSKHPLGKICLHNMVLEKLSANSREVLKKMKTGQMNTISKNAYNRFLTEQNDISDRIVSQAQIIFTTNIASGSRQLKAIKELPVTIMDESTQSSEAHTLVPLSLPGTKRFIFVGDEKQLSSFSNIPQLEMSLFERILTNGTYLKPCMLDTQYRMHPQISAFPIKKFYEGKLRDGVTAEDKAWPGIRYPLYWLDLPSAKESSVINYKKGMAGYTYINEGQALSVQAIIHKLIEEKQVPREEIGVITPYSAQRDYISKIMVSDLLINPNSLEIVQGTDRDDSLDAGIDNGGIAKTTMNIINGIFVSTIDSFQGHEKRFIIFSCVRNNDKNNIGFVRDRRRLNVALTRAKNGLIIVGCKNVMKEGDILWKDYIDYLEAEHLVFTDLNTY